MAKSKENKAYEKGDQCVAHIVPWALPNEEIPISLRWRETSFNEIRITIPSDFIFIDFINVLKVSVNENVASIKKINKTSKEADFHFGFVIKCTKIFDSISSANKIRIECFNNKKKSSTEIFARIFRPALEIIQAPDKLELSDGKPVKVPLHIRYIGFGDIQIKIEAMIGGRIVSSGESLMIELLKRVVQSDIFENAEQKSPIQKNVHPEIQIDSESVKKISEEMIERILEGTLPEEMKDEHYNHLKSTLASDDARKKWMEILFQHVEGLLLNLLLELFDKNPTNNVQLLDPRTKIQTNIKLPVEKIKIRIKYRDLIGNEYKPVEITTCIEDHRKAEKETLIEIPISIDKWENRPLLNVREMKIEHEG